jgi:hypothetical protein
MLVDANRGLQDNTEGSALVLHGEFSVDPATTQSCLAGQLSCSMPHPRTAARTNRGTVQHQSLAGSLLYVP